MDTSRFTPASMIEGKDEEERRSSSGRCSLRLEVSSDHFDGALRSRKSISASRSESWSSLFLFRFAEEVRGMDEYLWVVVGDLPSAYFVADDAPTPRSAAEVYCRLMQDSVSTVLRKAPLKAPLDDVYPVQANATEEMALKLDSRLSSSPGTDHSDDIPVNSTARMRYVLQIGEQGHP